MGIKKTAQNIILGFVPSKKMRHRLRMRMNVDVKKYIEFARKDAGMPNARAKIYQGHGGQKKIIVVLDSAVAYKFPLVAARADGPRREKMFTDAFRKVSPIRLPKMEVLQFRGLDVLKYEFISGKTVADLPQEKLRQFGPKIARQLAEFLMAIGTCDPVALRGLKPTGGGREKPGFMYGWSHNDIGGNFVINPETGDIVAFIDWETAAFCDWQTDVLNAYKFYAKRGAGDIILRMVVEYSKLFANRQI